MGVGFSNLRHEFYFSYGIGKKIMSGYVGSFTFVS